MKPFDYYEPERLEEAISLLNSYEGRASIVAGGTDLFLKMKKGLIQPEILIGLRKIKDVHCFAVIPGTEARIGAGITHRFLETSTLSDCRIKLLKQATRVIGSRQIRNVATIGGNICNAAPSADSAPALLVLDAQVEIRGKNGFRQVPLSQFYSGPNKTILEPSEIVTSFVLPPVLSENAGGAYIKHSIRNAMDLAMLGVAVWVTLEPGSKVVKDLRIGLATSAPTPIRGNKAEDYGKGQKLIPEVIERVAQIVSEEARPRTSWRSTAEYRREVLKVLVKDALEKAMEFAYQNSGGWFCCYED